MSTIQRVYGKGRYDGIFIGAAIVVALFLIFKSTNKPTQKTY
ncbi:hypothetical protein [Paenibacillus radicis (ex Xue et al. 2023)]|uniref:Uncharacterized protein n=1 Tax=Paenibacillus radicis (ex Xue et al. 2023) TaxID=2972489 RepID=A0ABT1YL66_9BACL|nr:hypothetical protein [Paenibacillus radicis (ex Xue et al. 2023)]MCR8633923.1 hypothetical protein [Paenibacillus radicis (ex Xue et al. 2023)]